MKPGGFARSASALLAVLGLLAAGCGGSEGDGSILDFDPDTGLLVAESELAWEPLELGPTTRPRLAARGVRLRVPVAAHPVALEVATGVPAGERAAFRIAPESGGEPLFFEVVDGGASGRWVARRLALPGAGVYRLEVLPPGPWARRLGRAAPESAGFSLPRLALPGPGRDEDRRPNLLLISADTLRADRLGCYGAERPTSPALDRLAADGFLVERVYAASNWTLPSHYSLFTGLDPSAHGVNPDLIEVGGYQHPAHRLVLSGSGAEVTLAEALRGVGYRTRAFTESGWVSARFGFQQGFDGYDSAGEEALAGTRDAALAWLREHAERGPWFLFLHTYEVHQPYHAPEPWRSRFLDPAHVGYALPGADVPIEELNRFRSPTFPPTDGDVEAFRALYDGEVAYLDSFVADLRAALEEAGVERNTVLVFTSDHGEELFDRGGFDHIPTLNEEVARVPLIVWAPGLPGPSPGSRLAGGPLSLTDLANTLLGWMGVEPERPVGLGRDLSAYLGRGAGDVLPTGEPVFAESEGKGSQAVRAVWLESEGRLFKYLLRHARMGPEEGLFDLRSDPAEAHSIASHREDMLERLREEVARRETAAASIREALGVGEGDQLDRETLEALRALGYVN